MVNRELRGGATQSPEPLNLARERSGGKMSYAAYGCPRYRTFPDHHGLTRLAREEELDAAMGFFRFRAHASKRVVPRRGDPPSLYRDGGFLRSVEGDRVDRFTPIERRE
jgi:hypothetical protein